MGRMTIGSDGQPGQIAETLQKSLKYKYEIEEIVETVNKPVYEVSTKVENVDKPVFQIKEVVEIVKKPVFEMQEERIEVIRQSELKAKKLVATVISDLEAVRDLNLHLSSELQSEKELRKWLLVASGVSIFSSVMMLLTQII